MITKEKIIKNKNSWREINEAEWTDGKDIKENTLMFLGDLGNQKQWNTSSPNFKATISFYYPGVNSIFFVNEVISRDKMGRVKEMNLKNIILDKKNMEKIMEICGVKDDYDDYTKARLAKRASVDPSEAYKYNSDPYLEFESHVSIQDIIKYKNEILKLEDPDNYIFENIKPVKLVRNMYGFDGKINRKSDSYYQNRGFIGLE